uniref:Uncharacterized protein n=1 Tax=Timema genevievae TaxID=629358 RepID=A0A7R9JTY9_TIMGE|nr:unnamed protein product [Timema genevievae]
MFCRRGAHRLLDSDLASSLLVSKSEGGSLKREIRRLQQSVSRKRTVRGQVRGDGEISIDSWLSSEKKVFVHSMASEESSRKLDTVECLPPLLSSATGGGPPSLLDPGCCGYTSLFNFVLIPLLTSIVKAALPAVCICQDSVREELGRWQVKTGVLMAPEYKHVLFLSKDWCADGSRV